MDNLKDFGYAILKLVNNNEHLVKKNATQRKEIAHLKMRLDDSLAEVKRLRAERDRLSAEKNSE